MKKTNAARILDRLGIDYRLVEYNAEDGDAETLAERAAEALGQDVDTVFKTLVARGDRTGVVFAIVPASCSVDLKALARLSGNRRVDLVPLAEVENLTGYVRGAVTALGAKKAYPSFIDEFAMLAGEIGVSAGSKGVELILAPTDYVRATGATIGNITA